MSNDTSDKPVKMSQFFDERANGYDKNMKQSVTSFEKFYNIILVPIERTKEAVEILTPQDKRMYAGITSFRFRAITEDADYGKLHRTLLSKYKINASPYGGMRRGGAIRVSPHLYCSLKDMDTFAAALKDILG